MHTNTYHHAYSTINYERFSSKKKNLTVIELGSRGSFLQFYNCKRRVLGTLSLEKGNFPFHVAQCPQQ